MAELVLSNTTSFFSGNLENLFRNAKKYGFKYVEIIPYRWTAPAQILKLEKQYGVRVAGIHLPVWWGKSLWQHIAREKKLLDKFFAFVWDFYLGDAKTSPAFAIAEALAAHRPYVIVHTPAVRDMGREFEAIAKKFHVLIENIPNHKDHDEFYWNPIKIMADMKTRGLDTGLVFDAGHFDQSRQLFPNLNLLEIYRQAKPEVIHISYNSHGIHLLPDQKEQQDLKQILKIRAPKYITIETNPLVSIKKGKLLLEKILHPDSSPAKA